MSNAKPIILEHNHTSNANNLLFNGSGYHQHISVGSYNSNHELIIKGPTKAPVSLSETILIEYKTTVPTYEDLFKPETWAIEPGKEIYALKDGMTILVEDTNQLYILNKADYFLYLYGKSYVTLLTSIIDIPTDLLYKYDTSDDAKVVINELDYYPLKDYLIIEASLANPVLNYKFLFTKLGWSSIGSLAGAVLLWKHVN